MRSELGDARLGLDVMLERGPALKPVLARDHELCVGELEWSVENGLWIGVREPRVVRGDARRGGLTSLAMEALQLFRLELELRETRTLG